MREAPYSERFWAKVDKTDTCWLWTAALSGSGYGQTYIGSRKVQAHRVAYELLIGPIPPGLDLDHLCRTRTCVNPGHLEPVTRRVNLLRGETLAAANAMKTHCPKGHPLSGANLVMSKAGTRDCRICRRERNTEACRRRAEECAAAGHPHPNDGRCKCGNKNPGRNLGSSIEERQSEGGAMTWLQRLCARAVCRASTHEVDWVYFGMGNIRRCIHCESPLPEPRSTVGSLHPDQGD